MHSRGLYDVMDSIYALALQREVFRWPCVVSDGESGGETSTVEIDLHGHTVCMAVSAVRTALMRYCMRSEGGDVTRIRIITGRGLNSKEKLKPVLRPEVQRMLCEEFFPPLNTATGEGNVGVLEVHNVAEWREHNWTQKKAKFMKIAGAIRNVEDRLKSAVGKGALATSSEGAGEGKEEQKENSGSSDNRRGGKSAEGESDEEGDREGR